MNVEYADPKFMPLEDIPLGSIWMAADGGSYGYVVYDKNFVTEDVLVRGFNSLGWQLKTTIDGFKLQYRYYPVKL
jgi:hypothetical protein